MYVTGTLKTYRVSKNTILSKPIMLAVVGWKHGWYGYDPDDIRKPKKRKTMWLLGQKRQSRKGADR